jgi:Zn-dependent peptidase ImmA (M78 family)
MSARTDEDYDRLGRVLREALDMDDQIYLDVLEALKRMKHRGYLNDYVVVPDADLPNVRGKYVAAENRIYLRKSVYEDARANNAQSRYDVAHEISHCALNHQHERKRAIAVSAAEKRHTHKDEREADRLAAAILAPSHRVDFTLRTTPEEIAMRFGLSKQAATIRTEELSRMYRRRNGLRRPLPPGIIDFLKSKRREGYAVTSLPSEEIAAMQVRQLKYEGEACPNCFEFKMFRVGTQLRCDACGTFTGEG